MAEKVLLTCDYLTSNRRACGKDAHTYSATGPQGEWELHLCDVHAEKLYEPFVKWGRVTERENQARRTITDAERPFFEDR